MIAQINQNFHLSKNFTVKELRCKCPSHDLYIDYTLIKKLQKLRDKVKMPIYILSGYRTVEYNKKIGGAKYSQHVLGKAADIYLKDYDCISLDRLGKLAEEVGFNGIGYYPETSTHPPFLHVDVRDFKARWDERKK